MQSDTNSGKILVDAAHLATVEQNISGYDVQQLQVTAEMIVQQRIIGFQHPSRARQLRGFLGSESDTNDDTPDHTHTPPVIKTPRPDYALKPLDLNKFLGCFPCLHLADGMVLDWVWRSTIHDGNLLVYARGKDEEPLGQFKNFAEKYPTYDTLSISHELFLDAIVWDNTPEGFFDISLFLMMLNTIYLRGHRLYYSRRFLYTPKQISALIESGTDPLKYKYNDDLTKLNGMDTNVYFEPRVPQSNGCIVSFVTEATFGGIMRTKMIFIDGKPDRVKHQVLIPHRSPIMF